MRSFTLEDMIRKPLFLVRDDTERYQDILEDLTKLGFHTPTGKTANTITMDGQHVLGCDLETRLVYPQHGAEVPPWQLIFASDYAAKHQPCFQDIDMILNPSTSNMKEE